MSDPCLDLTEILNRIETKCDQAVAEAIHIRNELNALKLKIEEKLIPTEISGELVALMDTEYGGESLGVYSLPQMIEKLFAAIYKKVGNFPTTVPSTLIVGCNAGEESGTGEGESTRINSLQEFIEWYVYRFDEIMGQFYICFEVEDIDLETEGNQSASFPVHNIAEGLARVMELSLVSYKNSEALISLTQRALFQSASNAQQLLFANDYINVIADYLGINPKEQKKEIQLFCTPNKDMIHEIIKESKAEVKTYSYDERERSLKQDLLFLLHSAAVIRGVFWQNFEKGADISSQFKEVMNRHAESAKEVEDQQGEDFTSYLEKVEQGFTQEAGISDTLNPWGMPYSKRPKIREIGGNQGGEDGN